MTLISSLKSAHTHTGPYLISSKVGRVAEGEMHKEILLFDRGLATTAVHGYLLLI